MTLIGIGAVLAGFGGMAAVVMIGSALGGWMMRGHPDAGEGRPPPGYLAFDFVLGMVAAVAGGVLTARIAPAAPLHHTIALAGLVLAMAIACLVGYGDKGPPRWYQAVLSLASAAVVIGVGWLAAGGT